MIFWCKNHWLFIGLLISHRNLELLVRLPGGDSVQGFFLVTLLVELAGVPAVRVKIIQCVFVKKNKKKTNNVGYNYGLINCTIKVTFQKLQTSQCGHVLQSIPTVISGVRCGDPEAVGRGLEGISQSIQDMIDALKLMQGSHLHLQYNLNVFTYIYLINKYF